MKTTWNPDTNEFAITGISAAERFELIHALVEAKNATLRRMADFEIIKDMVPELIEDDRAIVSDIERMIGDLRIYEVREGLL